METREPDAVRARPLAALLAEGIREFHPAYFALPMATGIVSIASHLLGMAEAAAFLFWANLPAYAAVWALTLGRALVFPADFLRDLGSHQRGPGFFTSVAATCVLGLQFAVLRGDDRVGHALWWLGMLLWCGCTYAVFVLLSIREDKPSLADGINGGWLVAVVATQSLCVLGCRALAPRFDHGDGVYLFLASLWLCGGMLYVWMISLVFYRYTFFRFSPSDLTPPWWINMGAVAISTVAGTSLVAAASRSALLAGLLPFVKGLTLMFWATATWWIPMLLVLGIWRHRAQPFAYDPLLWGLVFPLGMYALCTHRLGEVWRLPALSWIARAFAVVALGSWLLTFLGMAARILRLALLAACSLPPVPGSVGPEPRNP
jgi:tellurite resistance protein TehA-like permease